MATYLSGFFRKCFAVFLCLAFISTNLVAPAYGQIAANLPVPGTMVEMSAAHVPALLRGMSVHPENPFRFDFIVDNGQTGLSGQKLQDESKKLVNYFLASMTVPSDDLWVNLSPVEHDRIIPEGLGKSELGEGLLAQDYILKQLAATLMYPESDLGKKFWSRVYQQVQEKFGASDIPTDTFNKVWILPESATVYENGASVYVVDAKLKVMLDSDYQAAAGRGESDSASTRELSRDIMREVIVPEIEKEVNAGANFAPLRQIFYSLVLAQWYKEKVRNSILSKVYIDQNKMKGIDLGDPRSKEDIYSRYMEAYRKGVYNYIKEEYSPVTQDVLPRKYFSGGFQGKQVKFSQVNNAEKVSGIGKASRIVIDLKQLWEKFKSRGRKALWISSAALQSLMPAVPAAFNVSKAVAVGTGIVVFLSACQQELEYDALPTVENAIDKIDALEDFYTDTQWPFTSIYFAIRDAVEMGAYKLTDVIDELMLYAGDKSKSDAGRKWALEFIGGLASNPEDPSIKTPEDREAFLAKQQEVVDFLFKVMQDGTQGNYLELQRKYAANSLVHYLVAPTANRPFTAKLLERVLAMMADRNMPGRMWLNEAFTFYPSVTLLTNTAATDNVLALPQIQAFLKDRTAFVDKLNILVDKMAAPNQSKESLALWRQNGEDALRSQPLSMKGAAIVILMTESAHLRGLTPAEAEQLLAVEYPYASNMDFDIKFLINVSQDDQLATPIALAQDSNPVVSSLDVSSVNNAEEVKKVDNGQVGGIDMNDIALNYTGAGSDVQFDPAMMSRVLSGRVDGFAPVVVSLTPVDSLLPLLK